MMLTAELGKHLRVRNHMLQAQIMLLCNLVEIQKPCLGQPLFQKLFTGLARGVGHVPTCVHENRVLGDVRGVHEERRDILGRERPCGGGEVEEWPGSESTTAIWEENFDHGFWRSVADTRQRYIHIFPRISRFAREWLYIPCLCASVDPAHTSG